MIALRKLFQVFGRGTLRFLNPENRKILAYLRDLDRGDGSHETVLCVANLSRFAQPVSLDLADYAGMNRSRCLATLPSPLLLQPYALTLAPYSFLWFELQPAPRMFFPLPSDAEQILDLATPGVDGLLTSAGIPLLEKLLQTFLQTQI